MAGALVDVLFPLRCAGCGGGPWPFCPACRERLMLVTPPLCERCGRPTEGSVRGCRDCPPDDVETARAPLVYEGPVRSALHRLKFSGWRAVAEAFASAMAVVNEFEADAVTWVPLSPARRARRGFDQARALAVAVAAHLGRPPIPLLTRTADTPPQARRSAVERRRAMRGAFRLSGRSPPPNVLLVDDVLTTGATAAACAHVLRSAGAARVGLLTAARALVGPLPARCYSGRDSRLSLWLPGDRPR